MIQFDPSRSGFFVMIIGSRSQLGKIHSRKTFCDTELPAWVYYVSNGDAGPVTQSNGQLSATTFFLHFFLFKSFVLRWSV